MRNQEFRITFTLVIILTLTACSVMGWIGFGREKHRYRMLDTEFNEVLSGKIRPPYLWSLMAAENPPRFARLEAVVNESTNALTNMQFIYMTNGWALKSHAN